MPHTALLNNFRMLMEFYYRHLKNMRQPLADTMTHGDSSTYFLESKSYVSHTNIEAKNLKPELYQEDRTIRVVNSIKKLMQTETNYTKGKHYNTLLIYNNKLLCVICIFLRELSLRSETGKTN